MEVFKLSNKYPSFAGDPRYCLTRTNNPTNSASPLPMRHSPMLPRKRIIFRHNPQRIALEVVPKQLAYTELALRTSIKVYRKLTIGRMHKQPRRESVKRALSRPVLQRLPGHAGVLCPV